MYIFKVEYWKRNSGKFYAVVDVVLKQKEPQTEPKIDVLVIDVICGGQSSLTPNTREDYESSIKTKSYKTLLKVQKHVKKVIERSCKYIDSIRVTRVETDTIQY